MTPCERPCTPKEGEATSLAPPGRSGRVWTGVGAVAGDGSTRRARRRGGQRGKRRTKREAG